MSHGAPYVLGYLDMGLVRHSNCQGTNPEDMNPSFQIHYRELTSVLSLLSTWLIPYCMSCCLYSSTSRPVENASLHSLCQS